MYIYLYTVVYIRISEDRPLLILIRLESTTGKPPDNCPASRCKNFFSFHRELKPAAVRPNSYLLGNSLTGNFRISIPWLCPDLLSRWPEVVSSSYEYPVRDRIVLNREYCIYVIVQIRAYSVYGLYALVHQNPTPVCVSRTGYGISENGTAMKADSR